MMLGVEYAINRPFQLPWMFVTPTEENGLEYHLSPELSIKINGIFCGDEDFKISHILLGIAGKEVNELQAEEKFRHEILPGKSRERIAKSFREGNISCFFNSEEMEYLHQLFEEKNYIAYNISIIYQGKKVEEPENLPPKEFKLTMDALEELGVVKVIDFKMNKDQMEEKYEKAYEKKVAILEMQEKEKLWDKVKQKGFVKKVAKAFGSLFLGISSIVVRKRLRNSSSIGFSLLKVLVSVIGIWLEIYGRSEVKSLIISLKSKERVFA